MQHISPIIDQRVMGTGRLYIDPANEESWFELSIRSDTSVAVELVRLAESAGYQIIEENEAVEFLADGRVRQWLYPIEEEELVAAS